MSSRNTGAATGQDLPSESKALITTTLNGVKRDLKEGVFPALGGQARASLGTFVGQQTLSDNANLTKPLSQMSVRTLMELLEQLRVTHDGDLPERVPVLSTIAQAFGLDVIHTADPANPKSWMLALGDLSHETGDVVRAMSQALADDGRISPEEVVDLNLVDEVGELLSVVSSLHAKLTQLAAKREAAINGTD